MTIKEISAIIGISPGTIDRVIHNRGRVSEQTKQYVLNALEQHNYKPNQSGKRLAAIAHPKRIAIVLEEDLKSPHNIKIWTGLRSMYPSLKELGAEIVEFSFLRKFKDADEVPLFLKKLNEAIDWKADLIIILSPLNHKISQLLKHFTESGGVVVTLSTDIPDCGRHFFAGHDNYLSARTAMQLMDFSLAGRGKLLLLVGLLSELTHKQRLQGVLDYVKENNSNIEVIKINWEDSTEENILKIFETEDISGVLILSPKVDLVIEALKSQQRGDRKKLAAFDLTPHNIEYLKNGTLDFIIDQQTVAQGKKAANYAKEYILQNNTENDTWFSPCQIVVKENLKQHIDS